MTLKNVYIHFLFFINVYSNCPFVCLTLSLPPSLSLYVSRCLFVLKIEPQQSHASELFRRKGDLRVLVRGPSVQFKVIWRCPPVLRGSRPPRLSSSSPPSPSLLWPVSKTALGQHMSLSVSLWCWRAQTVKDGHCGAGTGQVEEV